MGRAATVAWAMFLLLIVMFVVQRVVKRVLARKA
jgi:cellobiose transport system permease protein